MATFILTEEFKRILEKQEIIDALAQKGYNSIDDFTKEILRRLNNFDANLNLKSIAYHTLQDTDTYIGVILDEYLNKQYNVCVIPPKLGTRSGFLSQQIFGFISNLINGRQTSESCIICDKPVIIVNCMVDNLANSAICNIISSNIIGFKYIDIFNRKEDFGTSISNLVEFVNTVSQYKDISKDIELTEDSLILKTQRLKNFSSSLTNEPYYFAINAYPAVMLAKKEGYKIDSLDFETKLAAGKSNKNIQAFVRFLNGLKVANFPQRSKVIIAPLQRIFYGAPGTGKSYNINKDTRGHSVIRTTFHPDSDYSTFVGTYKPIMEGEKIVYKFVKQAFLKAYLSAWKKYVDGYKSIKPVIEPQFLVIEEINRGNCAQIFGDIFQLLDRGDNIFSCYPIEVDTDIQQAIAEAFANEDEYKLSGELNVDSVITDYTSSRESSSLSKDIREGHVMLLPPNLYIWATMNTSDQSLFPIDSAFKRRWDWQYVPIDYEDAEKFTVKFSDDEKMNWAAIIKVINDNIMTLMHNADKQIGNRFISLPEGQTTISSDVFFNKVMFYLWSEIYKDYYEDEDSIFRYNGANISFEDIASAENRNEIIVSILKSLKDKDGRTIEDITTD